MIELTNITKTFSGKQGDIHALKDVSLSVGKGEIYGVIGYSGAGKSTLIRCVNLLEQPDQGSVKVNDVELTTLKAGKLRETRSHIGMIFQGFNLLKTATVYDNIAIPLKLTGLDKQAVKERVQKYLDIVGLADKHDAYPSELSGGQKQRVAIARALVGKPSVILADEPTGNLDSSTAQDIMDLLLALNREQQVTLIIVTHDPHIAERLERRILVRNGVVHEADRL